MKSIHLLLGVLLAASTLQAQTLNQALANPPALPAPTPYAIVAQDANSQIWQSQTYEQASDGTRFVAIRRNPHPAVWLYQGHDELSLLLGTVRPHRCYHIW